MTNKLLHSLWCLLILSVFATSCTSSHKDPTYGIVSYDALYDQLDIMQKLMDESKFGSKDGEFPQTSGRALLLAIADLEAGIIKATTNQLILQIEVDAYIDAAVKSVNSFNNSINLAVPVGAPAELRVAGTEGGNIQFAKGVGADANFDGSADFSSGTSAWTVELWVKFGADYAGDVISDYISTFDNGGDYQGWCLNFMGPKLRATVGFGSNVCIEPGAAAPAYDTWHHVAIVFDVNAGANQNNIRFYLNGEQTESAGDRDLAYEPNSRNLKMWAFQRPTNTGHCASGYIKKFRRWTKALSADEVKAIMSRDVTKDDVSLQFAWDFTSPTESDVAIVDITGKYTAKISGSYKWWPVETAND